MPLQDLQNYDKENLLAGTLNNGLLIVNRASGKAMKLSGTEGSMCTALFVMQGISVAGNPRWTIRVHILTDLAKKPILRWPIKELEFVKIQDIQPSRDGKAFWIATEDQGVFRLTLQGDRYSLSKTGDNQDLANENVQSVFEDSENQLWISTLRNGVFRLRLPDGNGQFSVVASLQQGKWIARQFNKKSI